MESGNTAFEVQLEDGRSVHRHIDHLIPRVDDPDGHHTKMNLSESGESSTAEQPSSSATVEPFSLVDNGSVKESSSVKPEEPTTQTTDTTDTTDTTVPLRRSTRILTSILPQCILVRRKCDELALKLFLEQNNNYCY